MTNYVRKTRISFPGGGGVGGRGGLLLINGQMGMSAGWGRIFTTGLSIMGFHFQQSS